MDFYFKSTINHEALYLHRQNKTNLKLDLLSHKQNMTYNYWKRMIKLLKVDKFISQSTKNTELPPTPKQGPVVGKASWGVVCAGRRPVGSGAGMLKY